MALRKFLFLILILLISSCGSMESVKKEANEKIDEFHKRYNEKNYIDIYEYAGPEFKDKTTYESFRIFISGVHMRYGLHEKSDSMGIKVLVGNKATSVTIKLRTKFKRGFGVETFVFIKDDGELKLATYDLNTKSTMVL